MEVNLWRGSSVVISCNVLCVVGGRGGYSGKPEVVFTPLPEVLSTHNRK